jgi:hypothetical protein
MSDMVQVTYYVYSPMLVMSTAESVAERQAAKHGGVAVTAEPSEELGEFRITRLFPREFAEAREYK